MDMRIVEKLNARNKNIIGAVLEKMQTEVPGTVDLIGIAGSFCSNDFHEKSDLDLLIVINSEKATQLSTCFILEDVAHDIYCSTWSRLEEMAEYKTPHISKLFALDIVYSKDKGVLDKYNKLRQTVIEKIADTRKNQAKAQEYLNIALQEYAKTMISDNYSDTLYHVAEMVLNIEYSIYALNNTYIKRGVKRIPEEIADMQYIPADFMVHYNNVFNAKNIVDLRVAASSIMQLINTYTGNVLNKTVTKKELTDAALTGTYEEIHSNWKNKMHYAADQNNKYLSLMTIASCQKFYNEMADQYNIPIIDVLCKYNPDDLHETALNFDVCMEEWRALYMRFDKSIKKYSTINEFREDYLRHIQKPS